MNKKELARQSLEMFLSWLRVFVAAGLAQLAAGVTDKEIILNAAFAALLPVILRALDPEDKTYGVGAND